VREEATKVSNKREKEREMVGEEMMMMIDKTHSCLER